ncbi:MAG: CBS domain-containing protein [Acidimicrobiia bacterium]
MKVRVSDVMTRKVITISSSTPLKEAALIRARSRVSGLPVVDEGRLVGVVTESDFVSRLAEDDTGLMSILFNRERHEAAGSVGELMSREPLTCGPDDTVTVAARIMFRNSVKRLPVLDTDGNLVGIVSRADLMSVFARPDERIALDIRQGGVEELVGAGDSVEVSVSDGIVRLTGKVGTTTEKRMLEEFARQVAGVVSVESSLDVSFDDRRLPPV